MGVKTEPKRSPGNEGIATLLRGTADAMGQLLAGHLKLARLELVEDAKAMGRPAILVAICAMLAAVGYGLVMLGLAAALRPLTGWPLAFSLLGGLHLMAGALGAWLALSRLKAVKVLDESAQKASDSMVTLGTATAEPDRPRTEMEIAGERQERRPELPEPQESRDRSSSR